MAEIVPGIHWLKLPSLMAESTLQHVNAYLVQGDSGYLLIDTGWDSDKTFDSLQKQMAEIGADVKDISQIVITHIHIDHYGLAGRLKQLSGAELAFHEAEREHFESLYTNRDALLEKISRWLALNGVPPTELAYIRNNPFRPEQFTTTARPDFTFHGGETISTGELDLQVLWTPGHGKGHICFYEPKNKLLIAGDCILPTITPNIGLHPESPENPLGEYLTTLKNLKKLEVSLVLPGHEDPFAGLKPRIDELIRHHDRRNAEILAALRDSPKTAYQISTEITWEGADDWQDMSHFHKRLAIFETLAHLKLMMINGQTGKISRGGIIYYRQT